MKTLTEKITIDLFYEAYLARALEKDRADYKRTGKSCYWLILQNSGFSREQFLSFLLDEDRNFDKSAAETLGLIRDNGRLELFEEWSKQPLLTIYVGNRILDELDRLYPGIDKRPR